MASVKKSNAPIATDEKRFKGGSESVLKKQNTSWKNFHANENLSGIEFRRSKSNELVGFITIKHDEILDEAKAYRIAILVNDDDTFTLPPKQTFEEMIQAKRRQQMLLYGPGNSSTNSSVLSDRAARRVATAARRQSALNAAISRQNTTDPESPARPRPRPKKSSSRSKSRSGSKKKLPTAPSDQKPLPTPSVTATSNSAALTPIKQETPSTPKPSTSKPTVKPYNIHATYPSPEAGSYDSVNMITSMKELSRLNPTLDTIDKKEIMMLLKSAPPGAAVVLSNGIVVKKSRRGGARAGAGRKRSRPRVGDEHQSSDGPQPSTSEIKTEVQEARPPSSTATTSDQPDAGTNTSS